jgi:2-oxoglutarate ferredoxin oxidoreductase subunit gamma
MIVRFAGFGGQGIVLSSYILGRSAVLDGKMAIQNQSYGSESRGGECRGDVIISDEAIYELEPTEFDILVAMTQPAYERFVGSLKAGGTLILEGDLVATDERLEPPGIKTFRIGATDIAYKKFGRKIMANMVLLGFMNTLLELVSDTALESSIRTTVPKGTEKLNLKAMREGRRLARKGQRAVGGPAARSTRRRRKSVSEETTGGAVA